MIPPQQDFKTFGVTHLATLAVISTVALLYVFIARRPSLNRWVKPLSIFLAIVLLANEIIFIGAAMVQGLWRYTWGLPLQICDLAIFATVYSLLRYTPWVWDLAYFWGLAGTLQAVLTPDLQVTFPEYIYFKFFLTHGCILVGVVFLSAGLGRPITFHSVVRVWVVTNLYAAFVALFNWLFKTNYLYLCRKPSQTSILDYLGPWPWYIAGLELVLIASLLIYYLPYYFLRKLQKRGIDKNI